MSGGCRCCSLRAATLGVAVLFLVGTVLVLLVGASVLVLLSPGVPDAWLAAVVPVSALCLAANVLLVRGARGRRRRLVLVWLVWYGVFSALVTAAWVGVLALFLHMTAGEGPHSLGIGAAVSAGTAAVGVALLTVMWSGFGVVLAFYRSVTSAENYEMTSTEHV